MRMVLGYIPRDKFSEKLCLIAVHQNIEAIRYVPVVMRSEEMCLAAVLQNGHNVGYAREKKWFESL